MEENNDNSRLTTVSCVYHSDQWQKAKSVLQSNNYNCHNIYQDPLI